MYVKGHGQGHKPPCHLKGIQWLSIHAKYEVSVSYCSKVMAKVNGVFFRTQIPMTNPWVMDNNCEKYYPDPTCQ